MDASRIRAITMPKWGLSMTEGKVVDWLVEEGAAVQPGDEVMEVETEKIASAVEATDAGILRRKIAKADQTIPVSGLLGILADADVPDSDLDEFEKAFVLEVDSAESEGEAEDSGYSWMSVGGRKLRYVIEGSGDEAVVLIHGYGGHLGTWLFNQQELAKGRRVIALDLPGHGESSKDVGNGNLELLASAVLGLMDELGLATAHLIGHSMGGAVAMQIAATDPERVVSLGLIASAGLGREINAQYLRNFAKSSSRREMKTCLQDLFASSSLVTRQLVDETLKLKRLDGVEAALMQIADNLLDGDEQRVNLHDTLASVNRPVLVLWGSQDRVIPANHAESLPGGVKSKVIEGAGHMVQMEAASSINEALAVFLSNT